MLKFNIIKLRQQMISLNSSTQRFTLLNVKLLNVLRKPTQTASLCKTPSALCILVFTIVTNTSLNRLYSEWPHRQCGALRFQKSRD